METLQPDAFLADCPTREIVARLAEKWTMLTLSALSDRALRFGAFHRRIEGVSQKMLTKTLRKLEQDGLVQRTVFNEMPLRVEYALTPLGRGVADVAMALKAWAEANMTSVEDARRKLEPDGGATALDVVDGA